MGKTLQPTIINRAGSKPDPPKNTIKMKKTIMTLTVLLATAGSMQAQEVVPNDNHGGVFTEYQNAERNYKTARESYEAADKQVESLQKQVDELKEQLKKAQLDKKNAKAECNDRKAKRNLAKKNCKTAGIDPKTGAKK